MDGGPGGFISDEHPFAVPPEDRDPLRRFRGRLAGSVTVWTSQDGGRRAGLTIASVTVADPGVIAGAVNADSDLLEVLERSGSFVVQLLGWAQRMTADRFALVAPAPGGPFAAEPWVSTDWGPRLHAATVWAGCRVQSTHAFGYAELVTATVEHVEVGDLDDPLLWQRGDYRHLR